jgi:hypothetical protein
LKTTERPKPRKPDSTHKFSDLKIGDYFKFMGDICQLIPTIRPECSNHYPNSTYNIFNLTKGRLEQMDGSCPPYRKLTCVELFYSLED